MCNNIKGVTKRRVVDVTTVSGDKNNSIYDNLPTYKNAYKQSYRVLKCKITIFFSLPKMVN